VEREGMASVRRLKGFHDEPLRGSRSGQRSVRLNRAYRVIYFEQKDGQIRIAQVIEVNKHEY
jgi:toxin HigB-1